MSWQYMTVCLEHLHHRRQRKAAAEAYKVAWLVHVCRLCLEEQVPQDRSGVTEEARLFQWLRVHNAQKEATYHMAGRQAPLRSRPLCARHDSFRVCVGDIRARQKGRKLP